MHDFKLTFLTERKSEDEQYAERMAKTVYKVKIDRPKSDAQKRYEDREMYPHTYEAYLARSWPEPSKWRAVPDAKDADEAVGKRSFDPSEISHVQSLRRQSKNTQGDFMSETIERSTTRQQEAENAFLVSPGISVSELTDEQRAALISMSGYTDPPHPIDIPKPSMLERFKEALRIRSKREIDKDNLAYAIYKSLGGKDEDL